MLEKDSRQMKKMQEHMASGEGIGRLVNEEGVTSQLP